MGNNDRINDRIQLDKARIQYYERAIDYLEKHIKKLEQESMRTDNMLPREYLAHYQGAMRNLASSARTVQQKLKAGAAIAKERVRRALQNQSQEK
jgi:exonuclease VII small subunit